MSSITVSGKVKDNIITDVHNAVDDLRSGKRTLDIDYFDRLTWDLLDIILSLNFYRTKFLWLVVPFFAMSYMIGRLLMNLYMPIWLAVLIFAFSIYWLIQVSKLYRAEVFNLLIEMVVTALESKFGKN
jgi:hypothetical protein